MSRSRRSRGLTIAGWSTLGGLWALSSIYAGLGYAVSDIGGREKEEGWLALLIPVAGPFVAMGTLNVLTLRDSAPAAILLVDGILQTSALAMLIAGAATRHPGRSALELTPAVRLTPFVGVSNAGVVGTF